MTLRVDHAAKQAFERIVGALRSARVDAGLSQAALSSGLPVRGRAISDWESGITDPTLEHLLQWSRDLGCRLVIVAPGGDPRQGFSCPRIGETWELFERRRLAAPLRNRRVALNLIQRKLGGLVGVSRDSIQRWELARVPPRPIALVVWAQKLGYSVDLRSAGYLPMKRL